MLNVQRLTSERFRRLSKEGFWIIFGQAMAAAGAVLGVRILTGLLEPTAYGELALGMTMATLANQVVLGPLGTGATRFYAPAVERGDLGAYLKAVRQLSWWATGVVVFMAFFAALGLWMSGHVKWIAIVMIACIYAVFSGKNSILSGIQTAARQRSIVALHQGMQSWAQYLVAAGLLLWLGATSTMAMLGYAIAVGLVLGSQYFFFRKIIPNKVTGADGEKGWRKKIVEYSWPMAATGVMSWGFFASQRWALELFASTKEVGYFSAIFQIGFTPITMVGGALMTLMMPIVFGRVGDGADRQRMNLVSKYIVRFCLVAFAVVLLMAAAGLAFHNVIFRLLVAEQYRVVSHYLPFAILSAGVFQISLFLSTIILASTKTRRLLPLNTIGNSIVIVLTFLCTRFYGMAGLFFAMVTGSIIHLLWNVYNSYKVMTHE